MTCPLRLLVLGDVHHDSRHDDAPDATRRSALGAELLRRAVEDARRRGGFDAVAVTGDLLDDGNSPRAGDDLAALRAEIDAAAPDAPLLMVCGNHDREIEPMLRARGHGPREVEIGGYRFVTFIDRYDGDVCTRAEHDRQRLADLAARPGGPVVALQHNPIHPAIESDYPYMHANRDEVLADYAAAGVLLSISGHYHAGQPLSESGGVRYFTAPALCTAPFQYALVTLDGDGVAAEARQLSAAGGPALWDCHAHTEFAYCGQGVSADLAISRCRTFGLCGVCLVEHAPQLYCSADDFWAARHVREPEVWKTGRHSRMDDFRRAMDRRRADDVRVGLEVELDADGRLTLRDEDRDWADWLVGAIHWLPAGADRLDSGEFDAAFLRTTEGLLAGGVDMLAHPFRIYRQAGRHPPAALFGPVADRLAAAGAAAEINHHINEPPVAFFAACAERGVKIVTGTDSHHPWETGGLSAHLSTLRQALGRGAAGALLPWPR